MRTNRSSSKTAAVVLALALLSSVSLPLPAAAFHDPEGAELLDERVIEGPFWFVYRVNVAGPESIVSFEIEPSSENRAQTGYGLWRIPVNGDVRPSFIIGSGGPGTTEVDVRWEEPVQTEHQLGPVSASSGPTNGFATTSTDLPTDDYWLVVMNMMPSATTATIRLYGSDEVSLVATSQGTRGVFLRETDFETPHPYTHVRVGAGNAQAQVHELVDGRADVSVEGRFFGHFTANSRSDVRDISYVTPDGTEVAPSFASAVLTNREPGDWTFKVNEWRATRAGLGPNAYVILQGADVDLP